VATPAADFHVHEEVGGVILPLAAAAMAAVGLVLLVACTNLAKLMLARGASRRQELAVRLALGVTRPRILALVLLEGIRPVLEGLAVGLAMAGFAAVGLRPAFKRVLPAVNPAVFTLLPIPFVIAALVACYLPARRAASVDPNVALRQL
jgi:ABC-type antimicrobial peptide transport system permease subunit